MPCETLMTPPAPAASAAPRPPPRHRGRAAAAHARGAAGRALALWAGWGAAGSGPGLVVRGGGCRALRRRPPARPRAVAPRLVRRPRVQPARGQNRLLFCKRASRHQQKRPPHAPRGRPRPRPRPRPRLQPCRGPRPLGQPAVVRRPRHGGGEAQGGRAGRRCVFSSLLPPPPQGRLVVQQQVARLRGGGEDGLEVLEFGLQPGVLGSRVPELQLQQALGHRQLLVLLYHPLKVFRRRPPPR